MNLLEMIKNYMYLIFIVNGILMMISIFIKDMCDNNEIKNNKKIINNIVDVSIKANLGISSLAIILTVIYLL